MTMTRFLVLLTVCSVLRESVRASVNAADLTQKLNRIVDSSSLADANARMPGAIVGGTERERASAMHEYIVATRKTRVNSTYGLASCFCKGCVPEETAGKMYNGSCYFITKYHRYRVQTNVDNRNPRVLGRSYVANVTDQKLATVLMQVASEMYVSEMLKSRSASSSPYHPFKLGVAFYTNNSENIVSLKPGAFAMDIPDKCPVLWIGDGQVDITSDCQQKHLAFSCAARTLLHNAAKARVQIRRVPLRCRCSRLQRGSLHRHNGQRHSVMRTCAREQHGRSGKYTRVLGVTYPKHCERHSPVRSVFSNRPFRPTTASQPALQRSSARWRYTFETHVHRRTGQTRSVRSG